MPVGEDTFQVRLERDGSIEFRHGDVAEKDSRRKSIYRVPKPRTGALAFTSYSPSPAPCPPRPTTLRYGLVAVSPGKAHVIRRTMDSEGARSEPYCLVVNSQVQAVGTDCPARTVTILAGPTVEFYLPKSL